MSWSDEDWSEAVEQAEREASHLSKLLRRHRAQIRRLLAGGREYSHGEHCVWCSEFYDTGKHGPNCEAKKALELFVSHAKSPRCKGEEHA